MAKFKLFSAPSAICSSPRETEVPADRQNHAFANVSVALTASLFALPLVVATAFDNIARNWADSSRIADKR
jgi:hypothetical protein